MTRFSPSRRTADEPGGDPNPVRRLRRVPVGAGRPGSAEFADLPAAARASLAAFMDAVVIVDPVQYQRRRDEREDVWMPLCSLHFGPGGGGPGHVPLLVILRRTRFQGPTDAECTHAVMARSSRPPGSVLPSPASISRVTMPRRVVRRPVADARAASWNTNRTPLRARPGCRPACGSERAVGRRHRVAEGAGTPVLRSRPPSLSCARSS